jgi:hypothetical protein
MCADCYQEDTYYYDDGNLDESWYEEDDYDVGNPFYSGCPACNNTALIDCQDCLQLEPRGCILCTNGYIDCILCNQPDLPF